MVKVCPQCGAFWFGGSYCHKCGPGHDLLDCASPEAEPWVHKHRVNIRAFYWARSAMLLCAIGMLVGIVSALITYEHGVRSGGGWPWKLLAAFLIVGPPVIIYQGIVWLFKRQVQQDLRVSGKTTATAPDMIDEQKDLLEYK
ncbi:MAG: hypothetical protein AB1405_07630 [Bdellovibrionota bacterium]